MIKPAWVTHKQLRRARCDPVRKTIVVFLCGLNLPAHDEEHDEDNGHLLRLSTYVRERTQDISEELRERMRLHITLRVDQRCEVGIQRSDKRDKRHTFSCATLAILQEIKEDHI